MTSSWKSALPEVGLDQLDPLHPDREFEHVLEPEPADPGVVELLALAEPLDRLAGGDLDQGLLAPPGLRIFPDLDRLVRRRLARLVMVHDREPLVGREMHHPWIRSDRPFLGRPDQGRSAEAAG